MSGDGQESRGQQPYEPKRCVCGEPVTMHAIDGKGKRAACSSSLCNCRHFVAKEES